LFDFIANVQTALLHRTTSVYYVLQSQLVATAWICSKPTDHWGQLTISFRNWNGCLSQQNCRVLRSLSVFGQTTLFGRIRIEYKENPYFKHAALKIHVTV